MQKNPYPVGWFRLTKKTAQALAQRELGTCRGLKREEGTPPGYYAMVWGELMVRIHPDPLGSGDIRMDASFRMGPGFSVLYFHPETLTEDIEEECRWSAERDRIAVTEWMSGTGRARCHVRVDKYFNQEERGQ